ncbi:hypothetical protein [Psychrobacter sp. NG27]|uniref:hypothetical protein n=1 Tax=Psychrobacter sp. NG27 TaxID=2781966 RepID=UPI0018DF22BC|nr:hypothetical protein [Psychrobacter sp. NG27]
MKALIEYSYPKGVVSLEFEIFADGFTQEFPVKIFFMDSNNSEHFVYVNDEAQYPSPVKPELLEIEYVYPYELEEKYINKDEDFDPWSIAIDELIQWFSECWKEVGGESLQLNANIASHDNDKAYNLTENKWEER